MKQIYAELVLWLQKRSIWENEAFRRLKDVAKLGDGDLGEICKVACAELAVGEYLPAMPKKVTLEDFPVAAEGQPKTGRLKALHSCKQVNMLVPDGRIEFGPQLTLIYGDNAVGKSGYARVMKHACRCHTKAVEHILGNVYAAPTPGPAEAIFELHLDGADHVIAWQMGAAPHPSLHQFAVFDSKAARSYLAERNDLPIVPRALLKLEALGEAVNAIKAKLGTAAAARKPDPQALAGFTDASAFGQYIAGISAQTPATELQTRIAWSEELGLLLTDIDRQAATLRATGPVALRAQLVQRRIRLQGLRQALQTAEARVGTEPVAAVAASAAACATLRQQKAVAAQLAEGESHLKGVGSEAWEGLLQAAVGFYAAQGQEGPFPGAVGGRCVLCQQELGKEAQHRLATFWSFLQSDAAQKLATEEAKLKKLAGEIDKAAGAVPPEVAVNAGAFQEEEPDLWSKVAPQFAAIGNVRSAVSAALANGEWTDVKALGQSLLIECDVRIAALADRERALGDAAQAAAELTRLEAQLADLRCRKKAFGARDVILGVARRLREAAALQAAADSISTLQISNKSKELQETYVTKAFAARVAKEVKDFGLRRVNPAIESAVKAGKTTQKVGIAGAKVTAATEAVFSEGERTALALAYFLAELGEVTDTFGAILDDPVTSMDHRIRSKVVDRIVALAKERQVIVLTHDLPFFCELREAAIHDGQAPTFCAIEAQGPKVGLIHAGLPLAATDVSGRVALLQGLFKKAKTADGAGDPVGYQNAVLGFYDLLRATWERCVEELLFNKTVQRFDKRVKTQNLTGVVVDGHAIQTVFAGMTKSSGIINAHDHAEAAGSELPGLDEMRQDLDGLETFRKTQKDRIKEQDKKLAHLKA